MEFELAVLGGGNMAEAILKGALNKGVLSADRIIVSEPQAARREVFSALGITVTQDNAQAIRQARQVMLAVKPQMLKQVTEDLKAFDPKKQVLMSIMAGISVAKIEETLGGPARIVRIMPNTPLLAGAGMSAIALGEHALYGDELLAMQIFAAAGEALQLEERHMDAVTAVSGSGPAYFFYLVEAMIRAGQKLGLSEKASAQLARQTFWGAAKLLHESGEAAEELRRRVTSPGGTTEAAIRHLETHHAQDLIIAAIDRAAERGTELGRS